MASLSLDCPETMMKQMEIYNRLEIEGAKKALKGYMEANKDYVLPADISFERERDMEMLLYMESEGFNLSILSSAIKELNQETANIS